MTANNPRDPHSQDEKRLQRALARAKRLNLKLTQVKLITAELDKAVASGKPTVSAKQVAHWSQKLKDVLNIKDEGE